MAEASRNNTGVGSSASVSAFESFVSKHFVRLLVGIAAVGGALAFLVPWLLYIAGITGEADVNLRLHILYVTGALPVVLLPFWGSWKHAIKIRRTGLKHSPNKPVSSMKPSQKSAKKSRQTRPKTSKTIYGRYMLSGAAGTSQQSSSFPTGKTPQPTSVVFMRLLA